MRTACTHFAYESDLRGGMDEGLMEKLSRRRIVRGWRRESERFPAVQQADQRQTYGGDAEPENRNPGISGRAHRKRQAGEHDTVLFLQTHRLLDGMDLEVEYANFAPEIIVRKDGSRTAPALKFFTVAR